MKRTFGILAGIALFAMIVVSAVSFAQEPQPAQGNVVVSRHVYQGPEDGPPPRDFVFVTTEMGFGGPVIKGAPYSAQVVTESVQTLSDGNRIVNKNTSSVYRDSEGRTRREQTLKGIGGLGSVDEPIQTIFINDPVTGVSYALDSRSHVAHKSSVMKFEWKTASPAVVGTAAVPVPPPPPPGDGARFEFKVGPDVAGPGQIMVAPAGVPPPGAPAPGPEGGYRVQAQGGWEASTYVFKRQGGASNAVKESLGKQNIEGVDAEGTRTTVTIPAGEIGNERPIEIVSERWYSPELQLVVMTRNSDPRSGETTYRLTNISRTEPAKSLFEVPADYTVKEGRPGAPALAPLPAKVRKPGTPE
jgi:hypothetical protein